MYKFNNLFMVVMSGVMFLWMDLLDNLLVILYLDKMEEVVGWGVEFCC